MSDKDIESMRLYAAYMRMLDEYAAYAAIHPLCKHAQWMQEQVTIARRAMVASW